MSIPVVISLCDRTGNMVRPWAKAGYECWCVDVQHSIRRPSERDGIRFVWGDVRTWCPPENVAGRVKMVFGFPPCTHVSGSGARDFRIKGSAMLRDSLEMFSACEHAARWSGARFMVENPVGKFSDHMGPPSFTFQPWEYGDLWTKRTCLWTGNGFVMPPPLFTAPPIGVSSLIHLMPPSRDRSDLRSVTPPGFAEAVFKANS